MRWVCVPIWIFWQQCPFCECAETVRIKRWTVGGDEIYVQKEPSLPNNGNGVSSNPWKPAETYRPTWNNALNEKFAQLDVAYKLRHYNDTMGAGREWCEGKLLGAEVLKNCSGSCCRAWWFHLKFLRIEFPPILCVCVSVSMGSIAWGWNRPKGPREILGR